ncbi:MAG TPA: hypothetical protein VG371_14425 [Solirubrobacteraceae bacterium]|nr:hypothetical protein [Solirubrobacteraceae bacterium]
MTSLPDKSDSWPSIDEAVDVRPSEIRASTYVQLRVQPVQGAIYAAVSVDNTYIGQSYGPTLGHALMNLGAAMAGIQVLPNVELRRRRRWRRG